MPSARYSQHLHRFLALGKHLEHLKSLWAADCLADAGDLLIQEIFHGSIIHGNNLMFIGLYVKPRPRRPDHPMRTLQARPAVVTTLANA